MNKSDRNRRSEPFAQVRHLPGVLLATAAAYVAELAAPRLPLAGAPVLAIALGICIRSIVALPAWTTPGLKFSGKYVLQAAIVLSGCGFSLRAIAEAGAATLPIMLVTLFAAIVTMLLAGKLLRIPRVLSLLIGIGTAICGASAIAAISTVLVPAEGETAIALATIFFYNIAAVLTFPAIGHMLHMSQHAFGVWAGTAINDTSSVVAAGYVYGQAAGAYATIVKLTRATFILPIVAILGIMQARRGVSATATGLVPWVHIVPWFIVLFLVAAGANTFGFIPQALHAYVLPASTFSICIALSAIGLQTRIRTLFSAGFTPLLFGGMIWLVVAGTSLLVQARFP